MNENQTFTFEEIFHQNKNRIYYHMHKLGIRDPYGEFYSEGLFAMWTAYQKYEPNKGPMSTYFNYTIRHRLIDLLRKKLNDQEKEQDVVENEIANLSQQHHQHVGMDTEIQDDKLWEKVFSNLTEKQRKWVYYYIIRDMSVKEIAERENVTEEAVKSWGKQARKKLRVVLHEES